jgi:cell division protease FtsH
MPSSESGQKERHRPAPEQPRLVWPSILWLVVLLAVGPSLLWWLARGGTGVTISYSEFREHLTEGRLVEVSVRGDRVDGRLRQKARTEVEGRAIEYDRFVTYLPSFGDPALLDLLREKGVLLRTEADPRSSSPSLVTTLLPLLFVLLLWFVFFRGLRTQGQQIFSMGANRARRYQRSDERVTFADVAGVEGAKLELKEIADFLAEPDRFRRLGGKPPKGVLLVGPPGTGKTLLARATAGEAGVPFFSITGSDFMEMFVGVGASRVRGLFGDARKAAPSIVFIDELDSIGRRRATGLGASHDEREQTLNQLLSEMDGFEPNAGVIVMAATNRPDILDPALLRPGRFDRHVTVELPATAARQAILRIHARNKPLAEGVDLNELARGTPGFSGADLENLLNEAALLAARNRHATIETGDIEEARDKILLGLRREGLSLTEEECRLLAYHEGGHAIVAAVLPRADPVHKVTIVPRGRALGVTQQLPEKDKYIYSRDYMMDRMTVMLAGRAAEQEFLGTETSGSESDLKEATHLARMMVLDWGMSQRLGFAAWGRGQEQVFLGEEIARRREYSDATAREVDEEVKVILEQCYRRAVEVLRDQQGALHELAHRLKEHEELAGSVVLELVGKQPAEAGQLVHASTSSR